MSNEILHSKLHRSLHDLSEIAQGKVLFEIPDYIINNLSHELRPYQEEALRHFIYTQRLDAADLAYNHLLFHMATGSGKTLVLASTILYLYKEQGHQNFIFFVNSDAIIKKTIDNLTNVGSTKYLFNSNGISIDGNPISIKVVDVFPTLPADNTIYLKLTTIQKLHMDLTNPRENGLTFESLKESDLVLLADEAHHINALTRNDKRTLNTKEMQERTWENTVNKILKLHPANRLVEYTATIDLRNDALFEKYQNKIVFQYDLKRFMKQGYSKNVVLLRANEEDSQKMFLGMLLSQYRKYIAKDNGIDLKPIILFKSNKISISLEAHNNFLNMVENLTIEQLQSTVEKGIIVYENEQSIWHKMFEYYRRKNLVQVIRDLQWEFRSQTLLNANDAAFLSEGNALLLNTLENRDNPVRAIFAVAKLNEGWDVLNLFDIIRISEGATSTKTTTDSEAQLIGRGARYYPFIVEEERSYTRRFDYADSDLKVIETLHYHTINENAYIKNLEKSLETANIQINEDQYTRYEAKVKPKIRKMDFFKNGKIYINKLVPTSAEDYKSLNDYTVSQVYDVSYETAVEQQYLSGETTTNGTKRHEIQMEISRSILQKALQRNKFYRFSNLKYYVPSITSIKDFIESENFLGNLKINLSLPLGINASDLSPKEKLTIVERYLSYAEKNIRSNYMKEWGTPIFEGVALSKYIDDYVINMNKINKGSGKVQEKVRPRTMRNHDWYIYDQAIVNGWESDMIDFVNDYIDSLRDRYEDVYLIRNERKVKVVEIGGTRGFMPDFLLYLKDADFTYQVFLEPKGDNLREHDQWKQDFLLSLSTRSDIEVLEENDSVRLIGIKFYSTDTDLKQEFREDFKTKLLDGVDLNEFDM